MAGFGKAAGMADVSVEQVRAFRLQAHHLDGWRPRASALEVVGACGMQNSPPGTWETALANRIEGCSSADALQLLYGERSFMQTWSLCGAPYVFPTAEADAFLTAMDLHGRHRACARCARDRIRRGVGAGAASHAAP